MLKFSVIVPTYNRAKYIVEAIDSVLQQEYREYEIIIVDDGSTDGTGLVIQKNFGSDSRVRYFYKSNEERGAARNFGLQRASGDYAVFFDSDDWMLPGYLQVLYQAISGQREVPVLVAAKYIFRDETGKEWNSSICDVPQGWYGIDAFLKGNMLACNFCAATKNQVMRWFPSERELASMEDWLFLLRNLQEHKIYIADSIGVVMREHSGRSMANNKKIIEARKRATTWVLQNIQFSSQQRKELETYSTYFYGIHEFLDGNRKAAMQQSLAAIRKGGMKTEFLLLLVKALIGKKTVDRIKVYAS